MKMKISSTVTVAGLSIVAHREVEADGGFGHAVALPAGNAGTLTTRTDNDTGVVTAASAGHGITDADLVDVYWTGGVRYGMTVTNVTDAAISIDGGAGDNLPTASTAVVICARVEIDSDWDGDDLVGLAVGCNQRAHVEFLDSGSVSLYHREIAANGGWSWDTGQGATPITGNPVDTIQASNGSTTAARLLIGGLRDSTP